MIQTNLSVDVGNGFSHTAATTKEDEMYLSEPSPELDEALARTLVLLPDDGFKVSLVQRDDRGLCSQVSLKGHDRSWRARD